MNVPESGQELPIPFSAKFEPELSDFPAFCHIGVMHRHA